ncbi:S8 family serine peptidase [Microbacterium sp.]|uniref:S8 family serine peptidase n=1 Tax=Microbacterium sp. TaxID=51671 RepID=UPI003A902F5D
MPHEPVQVVTNPEQLRADRDTQRPVGAGTDFYEGNDDEFEVHRDQLVRALRAILDVVTQEPWLSMFGGLGYVKVTMARQAIAKSHRPQKKLFRSTLSPHVATARIGEPIYAVTPHALHTLIGTVESIPKSVPTRINSRTGLPEPNPSRGRCEASAISSIDLWVEPDKRDFSAADGAAWLSRAGSGEAYVVELFPLAPADQLPELDRAQRLTARRLGTQLEGLAVDAQASSYQGVSAARSLLMRVLDAGALSRVELGLLATEVGARLVPSGTFNVDPARHDAVLTALATNPLVRAIHLPPLPRQELTTIAEPAELPLGQLPTRGDAPVSMVGVIDGGVSDVLGPWLEDRWGQLAETDRDSEHGTFISGLLVAGNAFNPGFLSSQTDGCGVVDIDVLPADPGGTNIPFATYYPGGVPDFLDELEEAVRDARERLGVRVFNFSMNFDAPGDSERYGIAARRLDEIAKQLDVIFVISAGNLSAVDRRPEWHTDPTLALTAFTADASTTIAEPAESLFNVSVSALNPPGLPGQVDYALARYSRRGPGLRGATKPDLAHVGGSGTSDPVHGTGLASIDSAGNTTTSTGTSFAAPLVARRLADLDSLIEGSVPREVLLGLLIHYATVPAPMSHRTILPIARDLAGFGTPITAEEMLERPDSEIVLVVNSVVLPREQHILIFDWPEALMRDGKCTGYAKLTLVARPVLAYEHGDERVRVNIDAKLMHEKPDGGFESTLHPTNRPATAHLPLSERDLMNEAMKWQIVKSFDGRFLGRGGSRTWKLQVNYLTRAEEQLPSTGVEFAAILTIADPRGDAPVFQQMRQQLGSLGIRTSDIRTSIRTRARATG